VEFGHLVTLITSKNLLNKVRYLLVVTAQNMAVLWIKAKEEQTLIDLLSIPL
jgi:hypothetical protein